MTSNMKLKVDVMEYQEIRKESKEKIRKIRINEADPIKTELISIPTVKNEMELSDIKMEVDTDMDVKPELFSTKRDFGGEIKNENDSKITSFISQLNADYPGLDVDSVK